MLIYAPLLVGPGIITGVTACAGAAMMPIKRRPRAVKLGAIDMRVRSAYAAPPRRARPAKASAVCTPLTPVLASAVRPAAWGCGAWWATGVIAGCSTAPITGACCTGAAGLAGAGVTLLLPAAEPAAEPVALPHPNRKGKHDSNQLLPLLSAAVINRLLEPVALPK